MRTNTLVRVGVLGLALLLSSGTSLTQTDRRDGNWWLRQPDSDKSFYVLGFIDGIHMGNEFSFWGIPDKYKNDPALTQSYTDYALRFVSNVTVGQLKDGLGMFYSDYRNRRIKLGGAVWLVLNSIAGTPEAKLQSMIENWRKNDLD
jgi:hypothetical protein